MSHNLRLCGGRFNPNTGSNNFKFSSKQLKFVTKSLERGLNYYVQGYIHDVKIFNEKNVVQVTAKCWRSMRKSEKPHQLNLTLSTRSITDSFCSCTAGQVSQFVLKENQK